MTADPELAAAIGLPPDPDSDGLRLLLTASAIRMRPAHWTWQDRIPPGFADTESHNPPQNGRNANPWERSRLVSTHAPRYCNVAEFEFRGLRVTTVG